MALIRKYFYIVLFISLFLSINLKAQIDENKKVDRAKIIYSNLEYNTTAYNDLKQIWTITDPTFIRQVFSKLLLSNAIKLNGKSIDRKQIESTIQDLYDGRVYIELKRRYFDDEIEQLRFFTENTSRNSLVVVKDENGEDKEILVKKYFFDPIKDPIHIKNIVGEKIYEVLKRKQYHFTDLSKLEFDTQEGYNYDIYMSLFNPYLMFYKFTTNQRNKFLVSFFGNWGEDHLSLPGWYGQDYIMGVRLRYIDSLFSKDQYDAYQVDIGIGNSVMQPTIESSKDEFGKRLYRTGYNFYLKVSGNPLKMWRKDLKKLYLSMTLNLSVTEFNATEYNIDYFSTFYSMRNYFILFGKWMDLANLSDFGNLSVGGGYATHDINHYFLDPAFVKMQELNTNVENGFEHWIYADANIANYAGVIQHDFGLNLNLQVSEGYGYFGFRTKLMLSDILGIDFRYIKSFMFSDDQLPFHRLDSYVVVSPIIRINY